MSDVTVAPFTKDELNAASKMAAPFSKEEIAAASPKVMSQGDVYAKSIEDLGGKIADSAPVKWVGDKVERYLDAPVRAQIGALQTGKSLDESRKASWDQFGNATLPSTPNATEIMARTGLSTKNLSEYVPGAFSETGEGLPLKKGGIADQSPASIAGIAVTPSAWLPAGEAIGATGKLIPGAAKASVTAAELASEAGQKFISPFASGAEIATKPSLVPNLTFKIGEKLTGGEINAARAAEATQGLSAAETAKLGKPGDIAGTMETAPGLKKTIKDIAESKVGQVMGTAGAISSLKLATPLAAVAATMTPKTYFLMVSAAKLPGEAATALWDAYQSGKPAQTAETIAQLTEKYPAKMAKFTNILSDQAAASEQKAPASAMQRRLSP